MTFYKMYIFILAVFKMHDTYNFLMACDWSPCLLLSIAECHSHHKLVQVSTPIRKFAKKNVQIIL